MGPTGADRRDAWRSPWRLRLLTVIPSPGQNLSIGAQGQTVIAAGGDGGGIRDRVRHGRLAVGVPSPGDQLARAAQGQPVPGARRDCDEVVMGRNIAPGGQPAIRAQG